jgi:hypothetical protein
VGIYSNWPDDQIPPPARSPEQNKSRQAGAEIATALEAIMRAMRDYELDASEAASRDIFAAAQHLDAAGELFRELGAQAPTNSVAVPAHIKSALFAVQALAQMIGGPLMDGIPPFWDNPNAQVSVRDLMEFTRALVSRWAGMIRDFKPDVSRSSAGRRMAVDAANLQLLTIMVAEILAEQARLE